MSANQPGYQMSTTVPNAPQQTRIFNVPSRSQIECYMQKYSTTSSVFAEQSITNPDYQKTLYTISCLLQAELFDDITEAAQQDPCTNIELNMTTSLPPHFGGLQPNIPKDVMDRETADDQDLRVQLEAGTVPTLDTILRFVSYVQQSAKYSPQCNIVAFVYIKRMMDAKCILTMDNWRGMWLGSIIIAQKIFDDGSLRTSSFATIMPGVTRKCLKALELRIFMLLRYATGVKPTIYARFYFELREIFKTITGELAQSSNPENRNSRPARRLPLTIKNARLLQSPSDDPRITPMKNKPTLPQGRTNDASVAISNLTTGTQSRSDVWPHAASPKTQRVAMQPSTVQDRETMRGETRLQNMRYPDTASISLASNNGTGYTTTSCASSVVSYHPSRSNSESVVDSADTVVLHGGAPLASSAGAGSGSGMSAMNAAAATGTTSGAAGVTGKPPLSHLSVPGAFSTASLAVTKPPPTARAKRVPAITYEDFTYARSVHSRSSIFVLS